MFRIKLALVVGGVVLTFFGIQEMRLSASSGSEPQKLSLAQLESRGYGDNAWVEMGNFVLCDWDYVYSEKNGMWQEVWVPAVPLDGEFYQGLLAMLDEDGNWPQGVPVPKPTDVKLVVNLPDARSERDMERVGMRDTIRGMIVNEIESLGSDEKRLLSKSYPGIDFDTCYIFEQGREPSSAGKMLAFIGGGVSLFLLGAGWFWLGRGKPGAPTPVGRSVTDFGRRAA